MPTCFVIQPFDSGKYDKRFNDIYKPAIEAAGLEPYRVDFDPSVMVPIEAIEKGIRQAAICLADISADNPNVWYELGYAFAAEKPVVMVCSEERGKKYPFDIQHRSVIPYMADAPSDFDKLRNSLTTKLKAVSERTEVLAQLAEAAPVISIEGLSSIETLAMAVVAGEAYMPDHGVTVNSAKREAERAGVTNMGFNLAVRKLIAKKYLELRDIYDGDGDSYAGVAVTELGWDWIQANESRFVLHRLDKPKDDAKAPF